MSGADEREWQYILDNPSLVLVLPTFLSVSTPDGISRIYNATVTAFDNGTSEYVLSIVFSNESSYNIGHLYELRIYGTDFVADTEWLWEVRTISGTTGRISPSGSVVNGELTLTMPTALRNCKRIAYSFVMILIISGKRIEVDDTRVILANHDQVDTWIIPTLQGPLIKCQLVTGNTQLIMGVYQNNSKMSITSNPTVVTNVMIG
jgi:hypothetical protein